MRARLPLLVVAATGALLYAPVVAAMGRQWIEDTTTAHGILLAGAAAVVVYRQLPELRERRAAPDLFGVLIVLAGLGLFVLGSIGAEVFVLRLSLPVVVFGSVLALLGRTHARLLLSAVALLLLAIPLPAVLVTTLTMPMQLLASQLAEGMLVAGNIPVVRDGNLMRMQHVTLDVAEACSGLRSITSLISISAVGTALLGLSWIRGAMLMVLALPIAIFGNGARVAATGYLTQWFGEGAARGLPHELTGYAAFLAMCAVTIVIVRLTRPSGHKLPPAEPLRA